MTGLVGHPDSRVRWLGTAWTNELQQWQVRVGWTTQSCDCVCVRGRFAGWKFMEGFDTEGVPRFQDISPMVEERRGFGPR